MPNTAKPIACEGAAYPNGFAVRVSADLRCPVCGRAFRATDIDAALDMTTANLVCGGCNTVVLIIERR
jgi:hypothetical protein